MLIFPFFSELAQKAIELLFRDIRPSTLSNEPVDAVFCRYGKFIIGLVILHSRHSGNGIFAIVKLQRHKANCGSSKHTQRRYAFITVSPRFVAF